MIRIFLVGLVLLDPISAFSVDFNTTEITNWLHHPPYSNETTIQEEIQCYNLPYGALGFASHILTYYTIAMLALQRSPWMPWHCNHHRLFDAVMAAIGLLATVLLSGLTIFRCRFRWEFIAIASWKLVLSITFGCYCFHAAMLVKPKAKKGFTEVPQDHLERRSPKRVLWWLVLYIPGILGGFSGLISLIVKQWHEDEDQTQTAKLKWTSVAFASAVFVPGILAFIYIFFGSKVSDAPFRLVNRLPWFAPGCGFRKAMDEHPILRTPAKLLSWEIVQMACISGAAAGFLAALYTDWILAILAENLSGIPSGENAVFYYGYLIAKRLSFASF
jgi:hypothetical protein